MWRYVAVLVYAFSAVALGAAGGRVYGDVSKVNGGIVIESGGQAGDVSTVNGSVSIGQGSEVDDVDTVNGAVRLDDRAIAGSLETVNGDISVGAEALVRRNATAVNGEFTLGRSARVVGRLENVNGEMRLEGAIVEGGISTVSGDVYLARGSRVSGGLRVEKTSGWNWGRSARPPRVTIESGAVVAGKLRFERPVDLYVGAGVELPPIEGVQPQRYAL